MKRYRINATWIALIGVLASILPVATAKADNAVYLTGDLDGTAQPQEDVGVSSVKSFERGGGWVFFEKESTTQELAYYEGVDPSAQVLLDLVRPHAAAHESGALVAPVFASQVLASQAGQRTAELREAVEAEPSGTLPVNSVAVFESDGGWAVVDQGVGTQEIFHYSGVDEGARTLVGVVRPAPLAHHERAYVRTVELPEVSDEIDDPPADTDEDQDGPSQVVTQDPSGEEKNAATAEASPHRRRHRGESAADVPRTTGWNGYGFVTHILGAIGNWLSGERWPQWRQSPRRNACQPDPTTGVCVENGDEIQVGAAVVFTDPSLTLPEGHTGSQAFQIIGFDQSSAPWTWRATITGANPQTVSGSTTSTTALVTYTGFNVASTK